MKILVTGGNGFIGSHLAKRLHSENHYVRVVDIKTNPFMKSFSNENLIKDLRDFKNCEEAVSGMDRVYHLAANMGGIGFITSVHGEVMKDNTLIDINMLEACRKNSIPRMFYSSSACAYPVDLQDCNPDIMLKEEDIFPYNPEKAYGFEKLYMEQLCEAYLDDYGYETRIARFHNIYGPYGTWNGGKEKAPAALCRKVAEAKDKTSIEIWGDGNQIRSFCYIDDCLDGFMKLMESDIQEPLNIGSEESVTIKELANMIIKISGKSLDKVYKLKAPIGVNFRNADSSKAKKLLGWTAKTSLFDGLKQTYPWIEEQVKEY